ncbi:CDP-diacylglycerol--glycerol-3-phosphate 3-phosphatidyltransferase [Gordonibacter sp. Marseille-P4307]|uniref:CDP-diacylglycerol--glycerol-3-phosphate 3-phosphatidyltransferase n=1 Tax=Gordonibacter sp. Marseille-P4307 TaxID=2161815 RepID=UPI000F53BE1A|nr:CDP-diacylglycerol--glycerol-3-phosphate 3-phosphatidyltransferase [Gordonibacter sp. Marseille-P4307]
MQRRSVAKAPQVSPEAVLTPANVVTVVRIALVPVFVLVLLSPWPEWLNVAAVTVDAQRLLAAGVFIAISATDWLDGYLARSRNEVTNFGKFMDPLADKILVAAALLALIELDALPTWVVLIILTREFIVSGVRMMAASEGVVIAASYIGKFKTVFQMAAIVLFTVEDSDLIRFVSSALSDSMWCISWVVMIIALVLTVGSMIDYVAKARDIIGLSSFHRKKNCRGDDEAVPASIEELASSIVEHARVQGRTVGTAESLTGGLIAGALTSVPGSSSVVKGSVVSYVDEVKHAVLGVEEHVLETDGAVSRRCAEQMAQGAREQLGVNLAVAVTGIAGPTGAEPGKPVGTVWMGLASDRGVKSFEFHFQGDRDEVREQTVAAALSALLAKLKETA